MSKDRIEGIRTYNQTEALMRKLQAKHSTIRPRFVEKNPALAILAGSVITVHGQSPNVAKRFCSTFMFAKFEVMLVTYLPTKLYSNLCILILSLASL